MVERVSSQARLRVAELDGEAGAFQLEPRCKAVEFESEGLELVAVVGAERFGGTWPAAQELAAAPIAVCREELVER